LEIPGDRREATSDSALCALGQRKAPLSSYNESDTEEYRQIVTERSEPNHIRMDKKEIKSPKLTAHFLLWIGLFLLAMFALIAHFVWRIF